MSQQTYYPFPLEKVVTRLYKSCAIYKPEQIEERKITSTLGIHLTYSDMRCYAREEGRFKLININKNLDKQTQRERFYHELCHILRHAGYQYKIMPKAFLELQEWDAAHFTRYAAIPFHMLKFIDLKSPTVTYEMSKMFKVSEELCQLRLEHIYRNARPKKTYNVCKE